MCCYEHIYPVSWPCIVLILNIIFPGVGTMLQSYCFDRHFWKFGTFFVGILQLLVSVFLIGWIWSIWHGCKVYGASNNGQNKTQQMTSPVVYGNGGGQNYGGHP